MNQQRDENWANGAVRVFVSHLAENRGLAHELRERLANYGFSVFVAHDDIEPMKEWENEIVAALHSMDILVALLSREFYKSKWTDQEVGAAVGRQVPVIPVNIGATPYGFMGRYQAISVGHDPNDIARAVFDCLFNDEATLAFAVKAYTYAVDNAMNFATANSLANYLDRIPALSETEECALVRAYNSNNQAYNAFDLQRAMVGFLARTTGHHYDLDGGHLRKIDP